MQLGSAMRLLVYTLDSILPQHADKTCLVGDTLKREAESHLATQNKCVVRCQHQHAMADCHILDSNLHTAGP